MYKSLQQLLDMMRVAGAIHTYPCAPDRTNKLLHKWCLQLERQGKVTRQEMATLDHCIWRIR